jgi:ribose transport system substrate-binding protein
MVAERSSESDYNKALEMTENILTTNPGLDAIYATNEPGVLGAARWPCGGLGRLGTS